MAVGVFEEVLACDCFFVQKISHHGTLSLFTDSVAFHPQDGEAIHAARVELDAIQEVEAASPLGHATSNLEIRSRDASPLLFTGVHDGDRVKSFIKLLQQHKKEPKPTYGFIKAEAKTVIWTDLAHPVLMATATFPAPLPTVLQHIMEPEPMLTILQNAGNEDITMRDWVDQDGYRERVVSYDKLVIVPVVGSNLIKVIESHRLFTADGRFMIAVVSDLGKTPYCKFFDPQVHWIFVANGDKTEFSVEFEMVWSGEPFVKSIIESKTAEEITSLYKEFSQRLLVIFGGAPDTVDEEGTEAKEGESEEDDFGKTRKTYKIAIIGLIVLLVLTIWIRHGRSKGFWPGTHELLQVLQLGVFFALLILF
jgi:hypothetical protein